MAKRKNPWLTQTWGGAGKQAAQAAGAAQPSPYTAPTPPPDPAYLSAQASAQRNVALTDADAVYQNTRLNNMYGFGDTSNPYSRANLLMESYRRNQRGTMNSYAAQGQLNSGAYERMQGENKRNYNIGFDQTSREYQDARYDITRGQVQAYADAGSAVSGAQWEAILRALQGGR